MATQVRRRQNEMWWDFWKSVLFYLAIPVIHLFTWSLLWGLVIWVGSNSR